MADKFVQDAFNAAMEESSIGTRIMEIKEINEIFEMTVTPDVIQKMFDVAALCSDQEKIRMITTFVHDNALDENFALFLDTISCMGFYEGYKAAKREEEDNEQ